MIFSQATCPMVMSVSSLTSVCSLMVTTYPVDDAFVVNDEFVVTSALSVGGKFVVDSVLTISVALAVSSTLYH